MAGPNVSFIQRFHSLHYFLVTMILYFFRWLDSSKTLYEQDVKENDFLYVRFKYYSFTDIDPRVSIILHPIVMTTRSHDTYLLL